MLWSRRENRMIHLNGLSQRSPCEVPYFGFASTDSTSYLPPGTAHRLAAGGEERKAVSA